jgi:hypothetical protein
LAAALTAAVLERRVPAPGSVDTDWSAIGQSTRAIYGEALAERGRATPAVMSGQAVRE